MKTNSLNSNTNDVTVVFDNYDGNPSTKDHTHIRRTGGVVVPLIEFTSKTVFSSSKKTFLSNYSNKQRFIDTVASKLTENNILVKHSSGDVDYLIALTALEKLKSSNVVCITDDTNVLVLLLHYAESSQFNIYLEASRSTATRPQWNVLQTKSVVGKAVVSCLIFIHAFLRCDTVSTIYLKGKTALISKVGNIKEFTSNFYKNNVSASEISEMSEKVMLVLYGNSQYETLNELRKFQYNLKVATSKNVVQARALPPTYNATAQQYTTK